MTQREDIMRAALERIGHAQRNAVDYTDEGCRTLLQSYIVSARKALDEVVALPESDTSDWEKAYHHVVNIAQDERDARKAAEARLAQIAELLAPYVLQSTPRVGPERAGEAYLIARAEEPA